MNERTRASGNTEGRTRTDIDQESGEWTDPAVDESMDTDALSGSRPDGDQVTGDMGAKAPWDSSRDDFAGRSDPDKRVNEDRPHTPRSPTQR